MEKRQQGKRRRLCIRKWTPARIAAVVLVPVIYGKISPTYATGGQANEDTSHPADDVGYDDSYEMSKRNMVKAVADLYQAEMKRQEEMSMEDAIMCDNGPKEISIFCHQAPDVKIVDLAEDHRDNNQCLLAAAQI